MKAQKESSSKTRTTKAINFNPKTSPTVNLINDDIYHLIFNLENGYKYKSF